MRAAILLLFATALAHAGSFFVHYEVTPAVDFTHVTPAQTAVFQQHGGYLMKLRDSGVLVIAGRMLQDPKHAHAIVILNAENEAAAREIAATDPAVHAGLMKVTVEPIELLSPAAK
jgi:uncharacterized protein YciI